MTQKYKDFPADTVVRNLPANAGDARDAGLIPGLGRSPGVGNTNPFQYSCLENPMYTGAPQFMRSQRVDMTGHTHVILCYREGVLCYIT